MDQCEGVEGIHRLLTAAPQCPFPDAFDDGFLSGLDSDGERLRVHGSCSHSILQQLLKGCPIIALHYVASTATDGIRHKFEEKE